ncbi:RNA polymerase II C-terminal domain phosphatase-like 4-like protein [Drosera capensis]
MGMSVASDSPLHSSSSDDFSALLDAALQSSSSESSLDQFEDEQEEVEDGTEWRKKRKLKHLDDTKDVAEQDIEVSPKARCLHPGSVRGMCMLCGERIDDVDGVALGYIHKDFKLASDELMRLRNADVKKLLSHQKLYLVLDLDHTLLNSTRLNDLIPEEEYLKEKTDSLQDVSKGALFLMHSMGMMTKLRPFVRSFLEEASKLFELHIYTMGEKRYAIEMAKLLDPDNKYFESRVISQADSSQRHQKGLDVVLGHESAALILDDTEGNNKDNLILMDRYHFFASSCRQFDLGFKSLSELRSDENESDGALATVLGVLRQIHSMFFHTADGADYASRDVRQVLRTIRKQILQDCKLVFSRVFPLNFLPEAYRHWRMAEQLGATCSTEVDDSITHVVSLDPGTEKSQWALKHDKFLVNPDWIEGTYYLWKRQQEENFTVTKPKKQ